MTARELRDELLAPVFFISLILAAVGFFIITPIYKAASADGKVDYCVIHGTHTADGPVRQRYWWVEGHRPWRSDIHIGYAMTPEEALDIAKKGGCPSVQGMP